MDLWVTNAVLVTGDGHSVLTNGVLGVRDGRVQVVTQPSPAELTEAPRLDAGGGYVLPGIVNMHTHGCCTGPMYSSGAPGPAFAEALSNVQTHLSQGETTLCDLSGLGTRGDVDAIRAAAPVAIGLGTSHFPETFSAAQLVDATGIAPRHAQSSARDMLERGEAVAIGEVGSGATLGGGVASYRYIPEAVRKLTDVTLDWPDADRLKAAALAEGPTADATLVQVLDELGLGGKIALGQVRALVVRYTRRPVTTALAGFEPAARLSAETGVPAVFHTCRESAETLLEVARSHGKTADRLVAAHANHTSMDEQTCLHWVSALREAGVVINVATVRAFSSMPEVLDRIRVLLSAGLVDVFSTDYGGGRWDSILTLVAYAVEQKLLSLPKAVAMATSVPARLFPRIGADRGVLQPGRRADFVLTAPGRLDEVHSVYSGGVRVWSQDQAPAGHRQDGIQ